MLYNLLLHCLVTLLNPSLFYNFRQDVLAEDYCFVRRQALHNLLFGDWIPTEVSSFISFV